MATHIMDVPNAWFSRPVAQRQRTAYFSSIYGQNLALCLLKAFSYFERLESGQEF